MARTPMRHRTDIPGEAASGAAEVSRRLKEAPKPILGRFSQAPSPKPNVHFSHGSTAAYKTQGTFTKEKQPLFYLPYELRKTVYKYLIQPPGQEFRIFHTDNGLAYARCIECPVQDEMDIGCWKTISKVSSYYNWPVFAPAIYSNFHSEYCSGNHDEGMIEDCGPTSQSEGFFYLLTVCTQIYEEVAHLIYSEHTFSIGNYFTIIDLDLRIPSSHLNTIRELHLKAACPNRRLEIAFDRKINKLVAPLTGDTSTTAERAFKIIAGMESLKTLRVEWSGYPGNRRRRVELLKPLCLVKQTESFVVRARWDWVPGEEELGTDVPFVVEEVEWEDWEENDMFGFSPDDPDGVDPEGFDEVDVLEE